MANTKITSNVIADGAITESKLASGVGGVAGIVSSADATAITIDSSENVGIGTSDPLARLQIDNAVTGNGTIHLGNATYYGLIEHDATVTGSNKYTVATASLGGHIWYRGSTEQMRIDASGNVGIGKTPNRSRKLEVAGDINLDNGYGLEWEDGGVGILGSGATDTMTFATAGAERMRISSAGKVGIGTTSPSSILHIEGDTNSYGTAPILYFGSKSIANPAVRDWAIGPADSAYGDFHIYQGASTGASPLATSNAKLTINVSGNVGIGTTLPSSKLTVNGSLSKSSGSFRIDHPLEAKSTTHDLVHSFVEAPQADNIYRGKVDLVNGSATVNIDTVAGMTEGTFVALNREVQCFTTNESNWDAVKGSVSGNILTIESQNSESTATISWLVIGERQDEHMYDTNWTDDNGKVIVEPLKTEEIPQVNLENA